MQAEQISTLNELRVAPVAKVLPHAQVTVEATYEGWIPALGIGFLQR